MKLNHPPRCYPFRPLYLEVKKALGVCNPKWASRFKAKWGWRDRAVNTAGNYLDYDNPVMVRARAEEAHRAAAEGVHFALLLNYDQLWEATWRGPKRVMWKQREHVGYMPKANVKPAQEKAIAAVQSTAEGNTSQFEIPEALVESAKRDRLFGRENDRRADPVSGAKEGMTVVTSCWGNGMLGPLFFNVAPGYMRESIINEFNEKWVGRYYVNISELDTHWMSAESTCVMYERLFKPAFRLQRHRCNLAHSVRGSLQCDAFTGNASWSKGHDARRQQFSSTANVLLPMRKPGGWSARGQACDAFHDVLRFKVDLAKDQALGFNSSLLQRTLWCYIYI